MHFPAAIPASRLGCCSAPSYVARRGGKCYPTRPITMMYRSRIVAEKMRPILSQPPFNQLP
jgi:hypothetical protein